MYPRIAKFLEALALLWLAVNLAIASVPRCSALFSQMLAEEKVIEACHDGHVASESQGAAFETDRPCKCDVLQFMAFSLPDLEKVPLIKAPPSVKFRPLFSYEHHASVYVPEVDPPRPKFS